MEEDESSDQRLDPAKIALAKAVLDQTEIMILLVEQHPELQSIQPVLEMVRAEAIEVLRSAKRLS